METNPSLLEGFLGRVLHRRKEEIGSFYRRGNYLVEGETSPINRSLILLIFLIPHKLEIERLSL